MRSRFTSIASFALAFAMFSSVSYADLRIGIAAEPYPPFSSKDASGHWVGWEIDLANALCTEMKEKCEITEVAWDGIIPALTAKKIDVIMASMSITDKRKEVISFSRPYYASAPAIAGMKNGDMDISAEHLSGKTIGVQVATIHAAYVDKHFGKIADIKTYQTQDEANQDLASGRIDYVVQDAIATAALLASVPGACCEMKATLPGDDEILGIGAGAGVRKEDTSLVEKLDTAIAGLAKAGSFDQISKKHGLYGLIETPK